VGDREHEYSIVFYAINDGIWKLANQPTADFAHHGLSCKRLIDERVEYLRNALKKVFAKS